MKMKKTQFIGIVIFMVGGIIATAIHNTELTIFYSALIIGWFIDKSGYYKEGDSHNPN